MQKFYTDKDPYYAMLETYIDKNQNQIIQETQAYLDSYSNGIIPDFSTNIDGIISTLNAS